MKIKFLRNCAPHEVDAPRPRKSDVLEVNEASAQRWIRRKAAELFTEPAKTPKKTTKKKES